MGVHQRKQTAGSQKQAVHNMRRKVIRSISHKEIQGVWNDQISQGTHERGLVQLNQVL